MSSYVVWGTGRQARIILNMYMSGYFDRNNTIEYFVDNDSDKWGKRFFLTDSDSRDICSPSRLCRKDFEKILICSGYANVIRRELIFQYHVEPAQIVLDEDIQRDIYREYVITRDIRNKSVLIVTPDKTVSDFWEGVYRNYFYKEIGVETLEEFLSGKSENYEYILMADFAVDIKTRGKEKITCERNIIERISKKNHISKQRILTNDDASSMQSFLDYESWGDENEEKNFLVLRMIGLLGIGSMINTVLNGCDAARSMGYIPVVDMRCYWSPYLKPEESGVVNVWEKFFKQPAGYTMDDIAFSKNIWISHEWSGLPGALRLYNREFKESIHPKEDMETLARFWLKCLKPKKEEKVLAVIYRGSDYRKKKAYLHCIQPDIEEYVRTIEEKQQEWGYTYDKIFLATESSEAIKFFEEKYGDRLIYIVKDRVSDSAEGYIQQEYSRLGDLCECQRLYYAEMRMAAVCDDLISGICAAYYTVKVMNGGQFKHIHTFNLGQYGIDDEGEL